MILCKNFQILYAHLIMPYKFDKKTQTNICSIIYHARDNVCGDLWEEGGDCKKYHETLLYITTMTGAAGRAFTHINILYTSFCCLPVQNFSSTRVEAGWFTEKSWVLSMALWLHTRWSFSVRYIFLQRWSLVPFKWLHKCAELLCLEFEEPLHFLNNAAASPKNWYVHHELQTYSGTNFFDTVITAEVCRGIIQQFIELWHKDKCNSVFLQDNAWPYVAIDMMSFLAEFFGERICN